MCECFFVNRSCTARFCRELVMTAAPPAVKSVLRRPLHELTEDDISQLTREDCRRYLKEKGMRRPSWNKSQAIQQVISLKSLLEPCPPNAAVKPSFRTLPLSSPTANTLTVNSNSSSSVKELSPADADGSISGLGEDGGLNQLEGPSGSDLVEEGECRPAVINSKGSPNRCRDASNVEFDQMTIFYSGKVNVYDGVPVDKQAHAILHLAASPIRFCQGQPNGGGNVEKWSSHCPLSTSTGNLNVSSPDAPIVQQMLIGKMVEPVYCRSEGNSSHEQDVEGRTSRQVSLQRYFEKRKDRGKFKAKRNSGSSSSDMQMYLNHQIRAPAVRGQNADCNTSSTRLGVPQRGYGSNEEHPKNPGLSVDLNDEV